MMILAADVGTTSLKMAVYRADGDVLTPAASFSAEYAIRTYNDGLFSDIEPEKWEHALIAGCQEMQRWMPEVDVVALSGTTPGLTAMDKDGNALLPAILMLDQRSHKQAQYIIDTVGMQDLLQTTGNMPVSGGCSLAGILWIRDSCPDIFRKTHVFGHSNTYIARWLTGAFAIDPSSASLSGLYNTVRNDMTWNESIAKTFGLSLSQLPEILPSHESPGRVIRPLADQLGMSKEPPVVIGGNDAVLAAYSAGIQEPGQIMNVNGTCEITLVCLDRCLPSVKYNIRTHVVPGRWLTLYVMNAGGKALEWFRNVFCREMTSEQFYNEWLPRTIDAWLDRPSGVGYVPYLMGSRYSLERLTGQLLGLTQETSRDEILAAMVRSLCEYQREHVTEVAGHVALREPIYVTGGAVNAALLRAKKRWMRNCEYVYTEQSSLKGAALLGKEHLERS